MGGPDELPVPEGEIVADKYRVERLIGKGGMGCVVVATHVQILQRVALKFLTGSGARDPDAATRFLREARAAAALTSDHVARVLDVGVLPNRTPYLVMEYLEGLDLSKHLQHSGVLGVDEAMDAIIQACDALGEAHNLGIVHRDVKPQNLFLVRRPGGRTIVKVLDFGIAKSDDANVSVNQGITGTATVMGTPQYMAPEQMTSTRNVDARADVWALGVVLYHALTRRLPFETEHLLELGALVLTSAPRPITDHRDLPTPLVRVIERCLQKDPDDRYANAFELQAALVAARSGREISLESARTLAVPIANEPTGPRTAPGFRAPNPVTARFAGSYQPPSPSQPPMPMTATSFAGGGFPAVDPRTGGQRPSGSRNPVLIVAVVAIALSALILFALVLNGRGGASPTASEPPSVPSETAPPAALPGAEVDSPTASGAPPLPVAVAASGGRSAPPPRKPHHVPPPRPAGRPPASPPSAGPTATSLAPPDER